MNNGVSMTTPSKVDTLAGPSSRREERKVLAGTLVGTTIEWYDFFIFAQLTATLLSPLFLAPLNASNPGLAQILSFALIGISFLFRPLGAIVAGRHGPDRHAAHLCADRRLGPNSADPAPRHPGLLRRR